MAEKIKKHWDLALILGVGLILAITSMLTILVFPKPAYGDVATTIVVTANVQEYLTFTSSATNTTLAPDLIDSSGVGHIASSTDIILTLTTSSADGYSITVMDSNAGLLFSGNYIQLSTATGTAVVGTNAFGIQGTSSDMTIQSLYLWATSTNNIGRASTSAAKFASSASSGSNKKAYVKFKGSCTSTQPNGAYTDTYTFTGVPTP